MVGRETRPKQTLSAAGSGAGVETKLVKVYRSKEIGETHADPILEMGCDVHPLVKDAHYVDPFVRSEVEDEMLPGSADPKPCVDFIVDASEVGF